jgi:NADH-quinone oxidoreductase subunit F
MAEASVAVHRHTPEGFAPALSARFFVEGGHTHARYVADGGYTGLKKVLEMTPDTVIDTVKKSNLRGRGGAGFPTGMKWSFVPKESAKPKYMVVNADESEPGTFKDRYVLARDPHRLLEGAAIGAYAVGAHVIYIYIRGEFGLSYSRIEAAVAEAYAQGIFGTTCLGHDYPLECFVHRGAGAYICGEETALLEGLEGKVGRPRLKPPFPAVVGAFGGPTVVNNVETLSCVPLIFERGVDWFLAQGCDKNGGPKLICISGHVERPGVYEVPCGYPCDKLVALAGGVWRGRKLKAIIPGGSSSPVIKPVPCKALAPDGAPESEWPLETQVGLDFDSIKKVGSMFGSAGMIVLDDTTCMVRALSVLARFYAHESCGQCTPCREGTGWTAKMLARLEAGACRDDDLAIMKSTADALDAGLTICVLAQALSMPVLSYWAKFRSEFEEHVHREGCWFPPADVMPGDIAVWEDGRSWKN